MRVLGVYIYIYIYLLENLQYIHIYIPTCIHNISHNMLYTYTYSKKEPETNTVSACFPAN